MNQVFLKVLNNSFTAGWMILAVILLRMLLKKAPKWTACLLWGFVAIRPFSKRKWPDSLYDCVNGQHLPVGRRHIFPEYDCTSSAQPAP